MGKLSSCLFALIDFPRWMSDFVYFLKKEWCGVEVPGKGVETGE